MILKYSAQKKEHLNPEWGASVTVRLRIKNDVLWGLLSPF